MPAPFLGLNLAYTLASCKLLAPLVFPCMLMTAEPAPSVTHAPAPCCHDVQVSSVGLPLDLDTTGGRLHAVCYIIQCYRLLAKIVSMLPPVHLRLPLWGRQKRGKGSASNPWSCEVMITPQHVFKTISQFSNFCRDAGTSKQLLERAYGAAKAAAEHQAQMRKKPFLACAAKGPAFKSGGFSVRIVPVGYNREVSTEMVSLCMSQGFCSHAACSCWKARVSPSSS